jgi:hypothetical protein
MKKRTAKMTEVIFVKATPEHVRKLDRVALRERRTRSDMLRILIERADDDGDCKEAK